MVQPHRPIWLGPAVAALGLSLALCGPARAFPGLPPHGDRNPAPSAPAPAADLPSDPAVHAGALPNGMRYAIVRTANAPGRASLRLRIAVGSLDESDAERGFAQLLARAPFDGTRPAPDGPLSEVAKAHGLTFTADSGADAEAAATTFSLDLPATDAGALDAAVALLRGAAGEPRLAPADLDAEWSLVVAHEHAANDLANRIFRARLAFLLEGQRAANAVGGLGEALPKKVRRGPVIDFHNRFYRPERAVLVVTGDVDVAAMEQRIRARFSAWRGDGAAGVAPASGPIAQRGREVRLMVESGAPASLQLAWLAPPDLAPDSLDRRRQDAVRRMALAVLNRRLAAVADGASPPFASAALFEDTQFGAARVTALLVNAEPGQWRAALTAADQAQRAAIALGVTAGELPAARDAVEADLKDAVEAADTRPPALIADTVAASLAAGDAVLTPAQDLALFEAATAGVTAEQVDAALKDAFSGQGPLLFVSSPVGIDGGEAALADAFTAIEAQPVTAPLAPAPNPQAFHDFGEAGKIAAQRDAIDLDTVFVRFENGVRLTFKPTKFKDGEVSVKVRVGGGLAALAADRPAPAWALSALTDGTAAAMSAEDDALALTGVAARDDLETLLRALAAPILASPWRAEAFARAQAAEVATIEQSDRSAAATLARALPGLAHAGDRRWIAADVTSVKTATMSQARAAFEPMLANGAIEVIVVGDITEAKAIDAVAATFAALPARPAPPAPTAGGPMRASAPDAQSIVLTRAGGDDGRAAILWPGDGALDDPRQARLLQLLVEVLRARLADTEVAPQAVAAANLAAPHSDLLGVALPGPAARLDALLARAAAVAADLRSHETSADELTRAKNVVARGEDRARQTNAHWLDLLSGAQDDPRRLAAIRAFQAAIERVTPADLRTAAQRDLTDRAAVRIEVRPAGS